MHAARAGDRSGTIRVASARRYSGCSPRRVPRTEGASAPHARVGELFADRPQLNFLRPKFLRCIKDFQPDVVHVVDAVWLGAQVLMAIELGWAGQEYVAEEGPALGAGIQGKAVVASYHT